MLLSILIPTYNRDEFLLTNLNLLKRYILDGRYEYEVEIVVSNNNSNDNTQLLLERFKDLNKDLVLSFFLQEKNIGLEANALYVLNKAKGHFVMYLGDDDYINYEYLSECIGIIKNDCLASVVIPNYVPVNVDGEVLGIARSSIQPTKSYPAGFKNCLKNSWKGHQLSGLVFKRESLFDSYLERKVNNIYLFIYFTAYSCLKGKCYLITSNPVKVTQPIKKKDWGYGDDGLINQIFDNYKKLDINVFKKTRLQIYFFHKQSWRIWIYSKNKRSFFKAFLKIVKSNNSTFLFKAIFPFQVVIEYFLGKWASNQKND